MARIILLTFLHNSEKNNRAYWVSFLALLAGGMIYLFWRENPIILFNWVGKSYITESILFLRTHTLPMREVIPSWIIYSLPDGLWSISYTLIICRLWIKNTSAVKFFWITTIPVLCLGAEVMQWLGFLPGVFCPVDLLFSATGIILGIFMCNNNTY